MKRQYQKQRKSKNKLSVPNNPEKTQSRSKSLKKKSSKKNKYQKNNQDIKQPPKSKQKRNFASKKEQQISNDVVKIQIKQQLKEIRNPNNSLPSKQYQNFMKKDLNPQVKTNSNHIKIEEDSLHNLLYDQDSLKKQQQSKRPIISQVQKNQKQQQLIELLICSICQRSYPKNGSMRMFHCEHAFCDQCSNTYLLNKLKAFQQMLCPEQTCNSLLNEKSHFYLSLPTKTKKIYEKNKQRYTVLKDSTLKLCPTPNCQGILKITDQKFCQCVLCKKRVCKSCFFQQHQGQCDKQQVNYLQDVLHYRQCSKCKIIVQKTQACNHMTCKCKHQFCYRCGIKWVSNHNCMQKINNSQNNEDVLVQNQRPNQIYRINFERRPPPQDSCLYKFCLVIFFIFTWLFVIPSLILIAIPVIIIFQGSLLGVGAFFVGLLYGPIEQFRQMCNQYQCFTVILLSVFFPIPIIMGIVKGIIKYENQFIKALKFSIGGILSIIKDMALLPFRQ